MSSTQTTHTEHTEHTAAQAAHSAQPAQTTQIAARVAARESTARFEIDRLRAEIHNLVAQSNEAAARATLDEALHTAARLQVVTANLDASKRPPPGAGRALIALADERLQRMQDAIERGMAFTADATMRRLMGE
jgi:hypothetical protein